jgi:hypothetical protein
MKIARFDANFSSLIIGERFKRNVYRPCIETVPSSTIAGFFRENFGIQDAVGVGRIDSASYQRRHVVVSLCDNALDGVSMPIETEYLVPRNGAVRASLYLLWHEQLDFLKAVNGLPVAMGAWRNKGFGRGILSFRGFVDYWIGPVELRTRLTERAGAALGVRRILAPAYGYLFESTGPATGRWVRSLFEGSIVEGPDFLGERYRYDI